MKSVYVNDKGELVLSAKVVADMKEGIRRYILNRRGKGKWDKQTLEWVEVGNES